MTMIDTPEGIAFARAAARKGALANEIAFDEIFGKGQRHARGQTAYSIVKQVYGFTGSRESVLKELDDYIEGTLTIRAWPPEYQDRIVDIVNEATRRAIEEYGDTLTTKEPIDSNVQAFFESGSITEQEGNDACLLTWVEVVRKFAGNH